MKRYLYSHILCSIVHNNILIYTMEYYCHEKEWSSAIFDKDGTWGYYAKFSSQEYWSGLPFPTPGIFPTQGSNWVSCILGRFFYHLSTRKPCPRVVLASWVKLGGFFRFLPRRRLSTVGHAILAALAGLISYRRKMKKCAHKLTGNF